MVFMIFFLGVLASGYFSCPLFSLSPANLEKFLFLNCRVC